MIAFNKLWLRKQLCHAIHVQMITKRGKAEIARQLNQTINRAADGSVRFINVRINMRFDRPRTAIDTTWQFSHLRSGDAINIKPIAFVSRDAAGTGVWCLDKSHLLELGHFAADSGAGHTKQFGKRHTTNWRRNFSVLFDDGGQDSLLAFSHGYIIAYIWHSYK